MSSTQGEGHKHFGELFRKTSRWAALPPVHGYTIIRLYSLRLFISNLGFTSLFKKKQNKYLSMFVITKELGVL